MHAGGHRFDPVHLHQKEIERLAVMKKLLLVAVCIVSMSGLSYAACSEEEMASKGVIFVEKIQEMYEKDAEKTEQLVESMMSDVDVARMEKLMEEKNFDAICKQYDEWISKLK